MGRRFKLEQITKKKLTADIRVVKIPHPQIGTQHTPQKNPLTPNLEPILRVGWFTPAER